MAICWTARPEELAAPSVKASTPWLSIHSRANAAATSGLFWSSACRISIGRPSTDPPTSSIASSTATWLPGPPTSRYGPLMSLSRPIFTGFEVLCARMIPGLASGTSARPANAARRAICGMGERLPVVWLKPACLPTVCRPVGAVGSGGGADLHGRMTMPRVLRRYLSGPSPLGDSLLLSECLPDVRQLRCIPLWQWMR
jgi:hypothetical protein